jgi:hypothetical protein
MPGSDVPKLTYLKTLLPSVKFVVILFSVIDHINFQVRSFAQWQFDHLFTYFRHLGGKNKPDFHREAQFKFK